MAKIIFKTEAVVLEEFESSELTKEAITMIKGIYDDRQVSRLEFVFGEGVTVGDTHDLIKIGIDKIVSTTVVVKE